LQRLLQRSMAADCAVSRWPHPWSLPMFSLVLTFVACLSSSESGRCQMIELPFDGSLMQCMMFGQHEAARWTNEHPGWAVTRGWKCQSGKPI
jgi:hypothetical protein